ncbi:MAG: hypothetical protein K6E60_03930 [Saccharofermentans sp.]|nr:hypothetical protein [Saccharofermentans sp.]
MNNTETTTLDLAEEPGIEEISQVSGGTAFTAGNYNYNYHISHPTCCMNCLKEGYFTVTLTQFDSKGRFNRNEAAF